MGTPSRSIWVGQIRCCLCWPQCVGWWNAVIREKNDVQEMCMFGVPLVGVAVFPGDGCGSCHE